ncbi:hypothetical protein [Zunongwangia sp. SCSIO 43204]|uniref:hypothetical protein n=1 Tax=Zunongwangia sp. SCSIO 43204 TaxID=2779359 RepID=UPI0021061430|nr:hypothetical protein [Zunongwangia sp. SCSIO 43204]
MAYNSERIYELEKRGHKLWGLWISNPNPYNAIGPFPYSNITDLSIINWQQKLNEIQTDIIYGLLNYQAVSLAFEVLKYIRENKLRFPFIWHFKEGPFYCRQFGDWNKLIYLLDNSDGNIFINRESLQWYSLFINFKDKLLFCMDGDLPVKNWFKDNYTRKISELDQEIHTVVPGRLVGLNPMRMFELFKRGIHLHLYGNYYHLLYYDYIKEVQNSSFSRYLHIHSTVRQDKWCEEFSKYDAGWLHLFKSYNFGKLQRMSWDDLNYPARISTLACASLPMIQVNNDNHLVATQELTSHLDIGIFYKDFEELHIKLKNKEWLRNRLRYCIWHHWKKPERKRKKLIRLGINPDHAYAWSRTRMGGWAVAKSPILRTTITVERLKMKGYVSLIEYYNR